MRDINEEWKHECKTQKKAVAQRLLMENKTLTEIMAMYPKRFHKTSLSTWKAELVSARDHETLDQIAHVDTDTIERLALLADSKGFPAGAAKLRSVAKGLTSLQRLEPIVHEALENAIKVANRAFSKHMDDSDEYEMSAGEFKIYMDCIVNANTALFNRPANQINVLQQNNVQDNRVVQQAVQTKLDGLLKGVFPDVTIEGEIDEN